MRKEALVLTILASFVAGCRVDQPESAVQERNFVGTMVEEGTRTSIVREASAYCIKWKEDDTILIDDGSGRSVYKAVNGGSEVTEFRRFSGFVPHGTVRAYYPESIADGYPQEQVYDPDNFGFNPMMAVSGDNNLFFKNLGSILKLDVAATDSDSQLVDIVISADQSLCGPFTVNSDAAAVTGAKNVSLKCKGVKLSKEAVSLFMAVPSGSYTNLVVTVNVSGNRRQEFKLGVNGAYTFERSKIYQKSIVCDNLQKISSTALFPDGRSFNSSLKSLACVGTSYESVDSTTIRKIVFESGYNGLEGTEIQDASSGSPIYLAFDASAGTAYVRTPADTLDLPADVSHMFASLGALTEISGLDKLNTSGCTDMSYMFCQTEADTSMLRTLDLQNFNTAKCTTMRSMFNGLNSLESINVSSFNTAKVTDFGYMFNNVGKVTEIDCGRFNTAAATTLEYMFAYCYNVRTVNVSSFNTAKCKAINYMFAYCFNLQEMDLSHFNTAKCTLIKDLFWRCYSLKKVNVKGFNTSKVTDMRSFFNRCDSLKSVDVSSFTGMQITAADCCNYFFYNCKSLEEIIAGDSFMFGNNGGTSFFCASSTAYSSRPGSVSKGLTIVCSQRVADWFATTNLRWINSGYSGKKAIPVTFKDYVTGKPLTVKWAAD